MAGTAGTPRSTKATGPRPSTACSAQCSTVSVIPPLFMTTVIPRAMPMISATPRRSRAPSTNESVRSVSLSRPISPMMTENRMNSAVISGNHHHSVGIPMPMSSQGMTPYIMMPKARPKTLRMTLSRAVMTTSSVSPWTLKWASLASLMCVDRRLGRVRLDPLGVPHHEEDPESEPDDQDDQPGQQAVADGDAGEPGGDAGRERVDRRAQGADPAAQQHDRGAGQGVVAGGDHDRDDQGVEREALLRHAVRRPAEGEDHHQDGDHPPFPAAEPGHQPCRCRSGSRRSAWSRPGSHRSR